MPDASPVPAPQHRRARDLVFVACACVPRVPSGPPVVSELELQSFRNARERARPTRALYSCSTTLRSHHTHIRPRLYSALRHPSGARDERVYIWIDGRDGRGVMHDACALCILHYAPELVSYTSFLLRHYPASAIEAIHERNRARN